LLSVKRRGCIGVWLSEIARVLDIRKNTASHVLGLLEAKELVESKMVGRMNMYCPLPGERKPRTGNLGNPGDGRIYPKAGA
jgi:predicted transcriptional regulator